MKEKNGYKSQFRIEEDGGGGFDFNYLNTHINNFLSENNIHALISGVALALKNNGHPEEAEMINDLSTRI